MGRDLMAVNRGYVEYKTLPFEKEKMDKHTKGRQEKDQHHKMGQSQRHTYDVSIPQNKMIVKQTSHIAFNILMGNKQSPKEQMELMFNYWRSGIVSDKVKRLVDALLAVPTDEFYIDDLYLDEGTIRTRDRRKKREDRLSDNQAGLSSGISTDIE